MSKRRPVPCDVCENADDPTLCPCLNVAVVRQTQTLTYGDGSTQPYTMRTTLCWDCRATFVAWGDVIVAVN